MKTKIVIAALLLITVVVLLFIFGPKQSFNVSWLLHGKAKSGSVEHPDSDIHDAVNFVHVNK